jgi:Putative transposase
MDLYAVIDQVASLLQRHGRVSYRSIQLQFGLTAEAAWEAFRQQFYNKPWIVYAKPPWSSPAQVLKYLSRDTHRVAIANSRLVFVGDGVVRFRYTDYAASRAPK